MTQAYPLKWPEGWKRTPSYNRQRPTFGTQVKDDRGIASRKNLTIEAGAKRVVAELLRLGVKSPDDIIISTNLKLNLAGFPRGDQHTSDPGVAVYWQRPKEDTRVMAIDAYETVAGNLGAIAATLEAMRAIERHGGAVILERAFTGFLALPATGPAWYTVLKVRPDATSDEINRAWRARSQEVHPDKPGGSLAAQTEVNVARDLGLKQARGAA